MVSKEFRAHRLEASSSDWPMLLPGRLGVHGLCIISRYSVGAQANPRDFVWQVTEISLPKDARYLSLLHCAAYVRISVPSRRDPTNAIADIFSQYLGPSRLLMTGLLFLAEQHC
jgi:hypothetical protein